MKSEVVILVGPPLSGKDTFLHNIQYTEFEIISRDEIIMSMHHNDNYNEAFTEVNQKNVDKILNQKISDCITQKKNVVINMTNLSKKSRNRHLSKFPNDKYTKTAIVFPTLELSEYGRRNNKRNHEERKFIPMKVIESMLESWEDVTTEEGFDTIIKL